MAIAHSSHMAVLETLHLVRMHWSAIPSILDHDRIDPKLLAPARPCRNKVFGDEPQYWKDQRVHQGDSDHTSGEVTVKALLRRILK